MDHGTLTRIGLAAGAAFVASAVMAHPHNKVDQQAHLTIASGRVSVVYYLAASGKDGLHMFDHLDADGDRTISTSEARSFGQSLVGNTTLTLDGRKTALVFKRYAIPTRSAMFAGGGVIRIEAEVRPVSPAQGKLTMALALTIKYPRFAPRWFIQPFVSRDLCKAGRQVIVRRTNPRSVMVTL